MGEHKESDKKRGSVGDNSLQHPCEAHRIPHLAGGALGV